MLNAFQKELRRKVKRAETRRRRLQAAGVQSPALERALSALGGAESFRVGKTPTKSFERALMRVVSKFLTAETSTVSGYKRVEKKRREGIKQQFRDMGVTASEKDITDALKGAKTFRFYEEIYSIGSAIVNAEFAQGAQEGLTREQIEERMRKKYATNPDIEAREMTDGENAETAYRPLTKTERKTAQERRAEIFEEMTDEELDELFEFGNKK